MSLMQLVLLYELKEVTVIMGEIISQYRNSSSTENIQNRLRRIATGELADSPLHHQAASTTQIL
jgi:hypothetical protein